MIRMYCIQVLQGCARKTLVIVYVFHFIHFFSEIFLYAPFLFSSGSTVQMLNPSCESQ